MNPAMSLDEECGRPGRKQNHAVQISCTDHTRGSLPDKEALLFILHLKQMHEERQRVPERHRGDELIA